MAKKEEKNNSLFNGKFLKIGVISLITIILVFLSLYFYLSSAFSSGDIVFLKFQEYKIGVVRAYSFFDAGFVVSWIDGSISTEKTSSIEKINKLNLGAIGNFNSSYNGSVNRPLSYYNPRISNEDIQNFSDYTIEEYNGEVISGIFYRGFSSGVLLADNSCKPDFDCLNWTECKLDYNVISLSNNSLGKGVQYHYCTDKNECLPNLIDSRVCNLGENITLIKKIICGREKMVLMNEKQIVLANIDLGDRDNFVDVNIKLIPAEEGLC